MRLSDIWAKFKYGLFVATLISFMVATNTCRNQVDKKKAVQKELADLKHDIDSISSIPPDTVIMPPVIIALGEVTDSVSFEELPDKLEIVNTYTHSIKNDSIDIDLTIKAKELYSINSIYRPIYKYQERIIEKPVPKYIEKIKEIKVERSHLYYGIGAVYDNKNIGIKAGLLYTSKKNFALEYDYTLISENKFHSLIYYIKF